MAAPLPGPARRTATYEDVLAAPSDKVAELIEGAMYLSPRPRGPHAMVSSILGIEIGGPFGLGRGGPGGWLILDEPELHLGRDIVVPDLAGWRRERMSAVADVAYFELPPDWVCEVLSASTEKIDRGKKLGIYAAAGVGHAWLISAQFRTLEVLRRQGPDWLSVGRYQDDAKVRAEPFDAVELDLAVLWADLEPVAVATP